MIEKPEPSPVAVLPVAVVAKATREDIQAIVGTPAPATTTLEEDREGVSRRKIAERAAPNTTEEQDRKTASQRKINLVWEYTQAVIAAGVIGTTLFVDTFVALDLLSRAGQASETSSAAMMQLNVMAALVTGFYFGRTNHQRTGGVGGDYAGPRGAE